MTSNKRISLIAIHRFLATFLIMLSTLSVTAIAENHVPLISQPLVPDAIAPGSAGFTLTVNGTGFASGSVVKWNGGPRATTFVSQSRMKATILSSDVVKAGTASITVVNPGPGGGTSNIAYFEVTLPGPSVAFNISTISTGAGNESVIAGDFNRDGKLDLVVTNYSGNDISVLLGNGNGTFHTHVDYATGSGPTSLAEGDFNNDGKLDLVGANSSSNNVSVLLGNGDGTFQASLVYGTGILPDSVVVGDFDGDGNLDLAVANGGSNDVSVLLGNGDGTFQPAVNFGADYNPFSVAMGDFNGDGKPDLAVANASNDVSVLLGNGDGTFRAAVNYSTGAASYPRSVMVADVNRDGKLDLIVADSESNNIGVLLGNGDGTFQPAVNSAVGSPFFLAAGDFNGDGKLDLAAASGEGLSILLGNGDGTFQAAVNFAGSLGGAIAVAVGDFNGDGRPDAAIPEGGGLAAILLQVPTLSLSKTSLSFADQVIATTSAAQSMTLTNTGYKTIMFAAISITGINSLDFSQTNNCGSGISPRSSCTITVTFTPTHIGQRTASLILSDNAAENPQSVLLSGTGVVSGTNATLSPTQLTFATQVVGTGSSAQSVTLSDYGTMPISIANIVASGDFHETTTCGSSLAAGASCTLNVTFKPAQIGTRTGTLSITDNAPGSPQKASLRGTGTVVKFNPTSLSLGNIKVGHSSSMTTTLTNTSNTTLSISGITITGSTAFSQTHTCGTSVKAGSSCTITVTFTPIASGSFSGAVLVSDNGGGSPQQVPLSGSGYKSGGASAVERSALATSQTAAVPSITGPSKVGTRVMDLVDATRDDPYSADGTKRELLVRFWYPAPITQDCEPAEYTAPTVWNYFSELVEVRLPEVKTNSCLNAPITASAHPVIVFTHGYTGTFTDYTFLFEDLASRGYVVASVDHTYEATAVQFPDGRFVKSVLGSHLAEDTLRSDAQSLSFALWVRAQDMKFAVDELARLNGEPSSPFAGKLDLTRVAVAGHSLGGLAALLGLKEDARLKAAVLLDASVLDGSASLTERPVLILTMGREQWSNEECRLWSDLRGPRLAVNFQGAEHVTPSDAVWLAKDAVRTGIMGPEKTIGAVRDYIAAFLDTNLRGKPFDPLLNGPSSDYPDAQTTTQKESLCAHQAERGAQSK
jgi:predicted dienelactone hydrolase